MSIRIAINGFGRIGRCALKLALDNPKLEVVAVNDLAPASVLAHLLKYDSVYGPFDKEVGSEGGLSEKEHFPATTNDSSLTVDGRRILVLAEKDPSKLPWKDLKIDVVLECTGRFTKKEEAAAHLQAGAQRVILSSPGKDGVPTFLFGVNEGDYRKEAVISNASCTTNCISPVAAVLENKFGIRKAMMTTIHAYTAEQNLVDGPPPALHKDLHRSRAAGVNIVPTTTGAAKTTGEVIPGLAGIFDGLAVRVPVVCGSLSDFTLLLKKKVTVDEVNKAFIEAAAESRYQKIIAVSPEPLVSTDIIKNPHSAVVDLSLTRVVDGDLIKVVAWYDNEWGYSNRLVELAALVGRTIEV